MVTDMAIIHSICLAARLANSGVCCNDELPSVVNNYQIILKTVWTMKWK
jgi:hypothetical protein